MVLSIFFLILTIILLSVILYLLSQLYVQMLPILPIPVVLRLSFQTIGLSQPENRCVIYYIYATRPLAHHQCAACIEVIVTRRSQISSCYSQRLTIIPLIVLSYNAGYIRYVG